MGVGVRRERKVRPARVPIRVLHEVRYIVERAAMRDGRVVGIRPLVFFSTSTGDAWVLDPADESALCLARDGSPLPVNIKESEDRFAIEWTHHYRIDGSVITFNEYGGDATTVDGYPTQEILRTTSRIRQH